MGPDPSISGAAAPCISGSISLSTGIFVAVEMMFEGAVELLDQRRIGAQ
jgi:hypothetical protein